jgi:hypothetical protein
MSSVGSIPWTGPKKLSGAEAIASTPPEIGEKRLAGNPFSQSPKRSCGLGA